MTMADAIKLSIDVGKSKLAEVWQCQYTLFAKCTSKFTAKEPATNDCYRLGRLHCTLQAQKVIYLQHTPNRTALPTEIIHCFYSCMFPKHTHLLQNNGQASTQTSNLTGTSCARHLSTRWPARVKTCEEMQWPKMMLINARLKFEGFPYSLQSDGPRDDPGV